MVLTTPEQLFSGSEPYLVGFRLSTRQNLKRSATLLFLSECIAVYSVHFNHRILNIKSKYLIDLIK